MIDIFMKNQTNKYIQITDFKTKLFNMSWSYKLWAPTRQLRHETPNKFNLVNEFTQSIV